MARRVFFSFHYKPDNWRASQVRNIGALEGNQPANDNDWEEVTSGGDEAIKRWISEQMHGRSCTVVLVGEKTAGRKWIDYEIEKSWNDGMGVVGIRIHGLKDRNGKISNKGRNPFENLTLESGKKLSEIVECYDPPGNTSQDKYDSISNNLENLVEEAIKLRKGS